MLSSKLLLVAVLALPMEGMCQSLGYTDADNPSEAVGMMQTTQLTARILKAACSQRFPELKSEIDTNLAKWQANEAHAIQKSNFYWAKMEEKDPSLATRVPAVEAALRKQLEAIAELPGEAGTKVFKDTCHRYFSALASGIWRTRTPNAYKYLDSAP